MSSMDSLPVTACWTPAMIADDADANSVPYAGVMTVGMMAVVKLL